MRNPSSNAITQLKINGSYPSELNRSVLACARLRHVTFLNGNECYDESSLWALMEQFARYLQSTRK